MKIPIRPTTFGVTTSTGSGTFVGETPPVLVTYGLGREEAVHRWHIFFVTTQRHLYGVLLGNMDTDEFGGGLDTGRSVYFLRPAYSTLGVSAPMLELPATQYLVRGSRNGGCVPSPAKPLGGGDREAT